MKKVMLLLALMALAPMAAWTGETEDQTVALYALLRDGTLRGPNHTQISLDAETPEFIIKGFKTGLDNTNLSALVESHIEPSQALTEEGRLVFRFFLPEGEDNTVYFEAVYTNEEERDNPLLEQSVVRATFFEGWQMLVAPEMFKYFSDLREAQNKTLPNRGWGSHSVEQKLLRATQALMKVWVEAETLRFGYRSDEEREGLEEQLEAMSYADQQRLSVYTGGAWRSIHVMAGCWKKDCERFPVKPFALFTIPSGASMDSQTEPAEGGHLITVTISR